MPLNILPYADVPPSAKATFMGGNTLAFENLDWFSTDHWLTQGGCFAAVEEQRVKAVLSASPECSNAAWLRFFRAERDGYHGKYFHALLAEAKEALANMGVRSLFSLAPHDWLENLLEREGFRSYDTIVTLQRVSPLTEDFEPDPNIVIRAMTHRDLAAVQAIDLAAFEPAWQLNLASLEKIYHLSSWHTIALLGGEIVAYQMSTTAFDTAHLARLAVLPKLQGQGIGRSLVLQMLDVFSETGTNSFSVNTQESNAHSLALYTSLGYKRDNRDILVMSLEIL